MSDTHTTMDHEEDKRPGVIKVWWIALRPFSFPASIISVLFGAVTAVIMTDATLDLPLILLAAMSMALLHGGANILNDVYDYRRGLDTQVHPVSGAVVRGYLSPRQAFRGALVFLAAGASLGMIIVWLVGPVIFYIGLVGVAVGVLYSATPAALKYHALGDLAVFLNFGILGALGGWVTQTGVVAWLPVVWSVPISLLVVGILHANNWRDIEDDKSRDCKTVAGLLGDRASAPYYSFLLFAPFVIIVVLIALPRLTGMGTALPLTFSLTLLALPLAINLMGRASRRTTASNPLDFIALDAGTAQLNLLFGVLCTVSVMLHAWVGPLH
ncbi:MAG: prenyltransferase [Gammaproteobacteria bacterium]